MPLSYNLRNLILEKGNAEQITELTEAEGINNLHAAGLNKVRLGITSLEELDRVTKE
jgi:Type II secretory pathway, ATPase PulE/Tfp pilus assembly pathway, ATPase PilB